MEMANCNYKLRLSVGTTTLATGWFGDTSVHSRPSCCMYPLLHINNCCSILHIFCKVGRPDNIDVYIKVGLTMLLIHTHHFINATSVC